MPEPRKRGRKPKPKTQTETESESETIMPGTTKNGTVASHSLPATTTTNDSRSTSPARRGRGRPKKMRKHADNSSNDNHNSANNTNSNVGHVASPERSRHGEGNDITILPPRWESVAVKAVPSMDAVVKVFCVHTEPNFSLPWQRKRQYSSSSSGFIVGGRRVLTNAHSVEHHTQVKVKKRGSDTKYLAIVLSIGTECDIGKFFLKLLSFWIFFSELFIEWLFMPFVIVASRLMIWFLQLCWLLKMMSSGKEFHQWSLETCRHSKMLSLS